MGVRSSKMPKWGGAGADILDNTIGQMSFH